MHTSQVELAGARFDPRVHGKFSFGNIANFVGGFVEQVEPYGYYNVGGQHYNNVGNMLITNIIIIR